MILVHSHSHTHSLCLSVLSTYIFILTERQKQRKIGKEREEGTRKGAVRDNNNSNVRDFLSIYFVKKRRYHNELYMTESLK